MGYLLDISEISILEWRSPKGTLCIVAKKEEEGCGDSNKKTAAFHALYSSFTPSTSFLSSSKACPMTNQWWNSFLPLWLWTLWLIMFRVCRNVPRSSTQNGASYGWRPMKRTLRSMIFSMIWAQPLITHKIARAGATQIVVEAPLVHTAVVDIEFFSQGLGLFSQ